ncbi:MAG: adenylate/guanylate cyclase domain-containing protein [Spirochaetia bacterium]
MSSPAQATVNHERLDAALANFREHPAIEKLRNLIADAPPEELFHIDPGALAESWQMDRYAVLEVMLRAVGFGVLDLEWAFHCPTCGGVAKESLKLSHTHEEEFCPVCRIDFRNTLDENVEVFFSVSEPIRRLPAELRERHMQKIVDDIQSTGHHDWRNETTVHGVEVLNHPVFGKLFGDDTLPVDQSLEIKSATVLFTDITGSTAMYERLGDARAYRLVRDHFDVVFEAIANRGGVPIKTIGDAVMGVFTSEADAVAAAFEMTDALDRANGERNDGNELHLKVGLHRGAVIVVTLNSRLDYFGRTVNIAARVESLSRSREICMSDEVFRAPGVTRALKDRVRKVSRGKATLKGIDEAMTIYRVRAPQ